MPAKKTTPVASKKAPVRKSRRKSTSARADAFQAKFPRHSVDRALRIPGAILEQNAGHPTSLADAAGYVGGKASGAFNTEVSSSKKYGLLESIDGKLAVTDRAKKILRPQSDTDEVAGLREAVLAAPEIAEVYGHYRGEYLPDDTFLANALTGTFGIPADKVAEFRTVFLESLKAAQLLDTSGERARILDVGRDEATSKLVSTGTPRKNLAAPASGDSCFVMQPFAEPHGDYYESVFRPAIEQTDLRPVRADAEIFASGKIMDQVWRGIRGARVLVAEMTTRNPNVFYELGLAHALGKPVVLVSSNEQDVPFDLQHIRVIYYDTDDPFWGQKLIDKVADNIRSALQNPEEAIFKVEEP